MTHIYHPKEIEHYSIIGSVFINVRNPRGETLPKSRQRQLSSGLSSKIKTEMYNRLLY